MSMVNVSRQGQCLGRKGRKIVVSKVKFDVQIEGYSISDMHLTTNMIYRCIRCSIIK